MTKQLEKTFDLPTDTELDAIEQAISVIVPVNPSLADIAKLSLDAYKLQMDTLAQIDRKYRQRYLEVANMYLNTARDALKAAEEVRLKQEKLDREAGNSTKQPENTGTASRKDLLKQSSEEKLSLH